MNTLTPAQVTALGRRPLAAGERNRLKVAVQLACCTQREVANALGMPEQYVSDVVRQRYPTITMANARKFANFFGCSIEDIFPQVDDEARTA